MTPLAGPRAAKLLVSAMLAIKVAVTAWNAFAYDATSYDAAHHIARARVGGLEPGTMNYDGPLYYLPALLFKTAFEDNSASATTAAAEPQGGAEDTPEARRAAKAAAKKAAKAAKAARQELDAKLAAVLRTSNVLYIAIFYLCWVCVSLPLLLPDVRSWFLASTLLLALPGYQKLGVMTHADNLFVVTSAACTAVWLVLHRRARTGAGAVDEGWWLALPIATGVIGLSRPFAAVPVALFSAVAGFHVLQGRRPFSWPALSRLAVALAIVGSLSGSWYAYRWANSGALTNAYKEQYLAPYIPFREGFDFGHYFTSFRIVDLLERPNRLAGPQNASGEPRVANSFFTLLYSETWGDHWLHFSGPVRVDEKIWPKRILLALALPVPLLLMAGVACSTTGFLRRARTALAASSRAGVRRWLDSVSAIEREIVIALWFALGTALYLYWQTGPALLPGKNSTVKFIYVATLYPLAIALASWWKPRNRWFEAHAAYLITLYLVALPVAIFWPSHR